MGKVGCLVGWAELLVGCLGDSVLTVNIAGVVKKMWVTSGLILQVILVGSICVSGPFKFNLSCGM